MVRVLSLYLRESKHRNNCVSSGSSICDSSTCLAISERDSCDSWVLRAGVA